MHVIEKNKKMLIYKEKYNQGSCITETRYVNIIVLDLIIRIYSAYCRG